MAGIGGGASWIGSSLALPVNSSSDSEPGLGDLTAGWGTGRAITIRNPTTNLVRGATHMLWQLPAYRQVLEEPTFLRREADEEWAVL